MFNADSRDSSQRKPTGKNSRRRRREGIDWPSVSDRGQRWIIIALLSIMVGSGVVSALFIYFAG